MNPNPRTISLGALAATASLALLVVLALGARPASACDHEKCAGGAACAAAHAACAEHAGKDGMAACACGAECAGGAQCAGKDGCACGSDKKEGAAATAPGACNGSCGCGKAAEGEKAPAVENNAGSQGGAGQRAYLDPVTGEFVAPTDGEPAAAIPAPAAARAAAPSQVEMSDGGVMARFPAGRESAVVATVDADGNTHTGCQNAAE